MIKINDIKPIVEIPDLSIYLYYGVLLVGVVLILAILFGIYKFFRPKQKTKEYEYYQKLQSVDFTQSKQSAYDIVKYGRLLAKEERSIRLIEELSESLSSYKYQKDVPKIIPNNIKTQFLVFMESVDV